MTVSDLNIMRIPRRLGRERSHSGFFIAVVTSVGVSVGLGGLATSEQFPKIAEGLLVLAAVALLVRRFGLGVWLAILVLGSVDALPGPELETIETPLHLYLSDVFIVVLIATLLIDNFREDFQRLADTPERRVLSIWSGVLLLLWVATVARSYVWGEITLAHAMDYGRDFVFFALLLPLFAATLTRSYVRWVMLVTLALGVVGTDITEIMSIATHRSFAFWVHPGHTVESNGITRLYVNAQFLEVVAAMLGFGLLLLARERRLRLAGAVLAPLSIIAVALELTRAQYIGCSIGLVFALVVWLGFNRDSAHFGRQHLARLLVILSVLGAVLVLGPASLIPQTTLSAVESRVSSVFSTLSSNNATTSTVAYRKVEASELEQVLGPNWVFGLGFLDPRNHYVAGIRLGSIRNGDVGVLNAIMTMGIIGAVLIYFPVVFILVGLIWRAMTGAERREDSWIVFGIAAWIVSVLTTSVTLVSLFSAPGLCIAAFALGIGTTCLAPRYPVQHGGAPST
ncbi:MAG: hypothetical protein WA484_10430 [Solirubrobacteraceae bacterium]